RDTDIADEWTLRPISSWLNFIFPRKARIHCAASELLLVVLTTLPTGSRTMGSYHARHNTDDINVQDFWSRVCYLGSRGLVVWVAVQPSICWPPGAEGRWAQFSGKLVLRRPARGTKKIHMASDISDGKPRGWTHYERAGSSSYFISFLLLLLAGNILTSAM